ncbi:MAG: NPCBM/NEW2 domain-containing protein [Thermoguttaceae bacterium]|nr:NPCBM/NEW2 domain-containing protein [Thermoguttaceae bacterium]
MREARDGKDIDALRELAAQAREFAPELAELGAEVADELSAAPSAVETPAEVDVAQNEFDLTKARVVAAEVGWGRFARGRALDGAFLCVGDRPEARGFFAHAPSRVEFELGAAWKTLEFGCGVQDGAGGSAVFVVRGDGVELYRGPAVRAGRRIDEKIDVANVRKLELIVEDAGDGQSSDWSVWLRPTLRR